MVEWSITAVLKTAVLRGTGGSNPSLSAIRILQDVDYQSCRIFFVPKKMHQKCTKPRCYALLGVFLEFQLSHTVCSTKKFAPEWGIFLLGKFNDIRMLCLPSACVFKYI